MSNVRCAFLLGIRRPSRLSLHYFSRSTKQQAELLGSNSLIMFTVEGIRVKHDVSCVGYPQKSVLNFVTQEYISLSLLID